MRLFFVVIIIQFILFSCSSGLDEQSSTIKKGKFEASITETGELNAVKAINIVMPYINWRYGWEFKILTLRDHGSNVKAGDTIAEIDKSAVMKALIETEDRLEIEKTNLNKLLIQNTSKEQELSSELASFEANYTMAKLQLDKYKFESEKKRTIKQLELDKATIVFDKAKTKYRTTLIVSEKNIQIQRIRVQQLENEIATIKDNLSYFTILCPGNGILQLSRNRQTNQMMKVADKVWPGSQIACVPDLSKMKILSSVNETDIGKVSVGQSVVVRLDAYPEVPFDGIITTLSRICYKKDNKDKYKVFDFEVLLNKNDLLLKPGMTVSCEILFARLNNVSYVSNKCIYSSDSSYFVVLEKNMKKYKVKLGPSNSKYTVIKSNLRAGDKLVPVDIMQTQIKN